MKRRNFILITLIAISILVIDHLVWTIGSRPVMRANEVYLAAGNTADWQ